MLNIILVLVGTIVGAGFASGKEIFIFFNVYGKYGLFGLFLSMIIIAFSIYKVSKIILVEKVSSYAELVKIIFFGFPFFSSVFSNIINIFLLISFIVMASGFSSCFAQTLNISGIIGSLIIAFLSFFMFTHRIEAIIKINKFFIIFLVFLVFMLIYENRPCFMYNHFYFLYDNKNWLISSFFYASYNLIITFPIIISLKDYILDLKQAKYISIFVSFFLLLFAISLYFLMNFHFNEISSLDLPLIYMVSSFSSFFQYLFSFSILGAIFTTAISSGFGLLNNLNISNRKLYTFLAIILCGFSVITSGFGFSNLISLLYPILGFIGFIQVVFILFY